MIMHKNTRFSFFSGQLFQVAIYIETEFQKLKYSQMKSVMKEGENKKWGGERR